jgi:hypothetical protein
MPVILKKLRGSGFPSQKISLSFRWISMPVILLLRNLIDAVHPISPCCSVVSLVFAHNHYINEEFIPILSVRLLIQLQSTTRARRDFRLFSNMGLVSASDPLH